MKYWIFSILTATIAYLFGTLNSLVVASRLVFRTNLKKIGKGERWLPNFRRIYGLKGFLKLGAVELVKDAVPACRCSSPASCSTPMGTPSWDARWRLSALCLEGCTPHLTAFAAATAAAH